MSRPIAGPLVNGLLLRSKGPFGHPRLLDLGGALLLILLFLQPAFGCCRRQLGTRFFFFLCFLCFLLRSKGLLLHQVYPRPPKRR